MNRTTTLLVDGRQSVDRVSGYIEQAAPDPFPGGHGDRVTGIGDSRTAYQAFGSIHGYTADTVFPEVLLHFHYEGISIFAL